MKLVAMKLVIALGLLIALVFFFRHPAESSHPSPLATEHALKAQTRQKVSGDEPLTRLEFDAARLAAENPPQLNHPNKKIVYEIACPAGSAHSGQLIFTRWAEMNLPEKIPANSTTIFDARTGIFQYEPADDETQVHWYLNFADQNLFYGYGSALFAQDEIQVAEHPALASLREKLLKDKVAFSPLDNGSPAPILIRGVQRRCAIQPEQIYGARFGNATRMQIENAVKPLLPPTITNLIAIVAPSGGYGEYSREDVEFILATAYSAFRAAKLASQGSGKPSQTVIHTGFWGCGAFGGTRQMMALLQILAARMAGVDRLVFHAFDDAGMSAYHDAELNFSSIAPAQAECALASALQKIVALKLHWGTSDGN